MDTLRPRRSTADRPWFLRPGIFAAKLTLVATVLVGAAADACPYCESQVGRQVARELFGDQFWINALMTFAPVPVLVSIVALIHIGKVPWPRKPSPP